MTSGWKYTWLYASDKFKRCRKKWVGAKVAKHTYISRTGVDANGEAIYAMSYCGTELVRWHADGKIDVRTAGWSTITTHRRVFEYSGVACRAMRGEYTFTNIRPDRAHLGEIVDDGNWKTLHRDENGMTFWKDSNGRPVTGVAIRSTRTAPSKKRNPLLKLCVKDVVISPEGKHYMATKTHHSPMKLVRYLGDPTPLTARVDWTDVMEVTDIFALAMVAGGWKAGSRFEEQA